MIKIVRYINLVDTAKLIRKELKQKFPNTKFSVRSKSYSGGSSIDVSWTDGASITLVNKVIKKFEGVRFDPMIDQKTYKRSIRYEGEDVRFGTDYVFARREYSNEKYFKTVNKIVKEWGFNKQFKTKREVSSSKIRIGGYWLQDYVHQQLYKKSF